MFYTATWKAPIDCQQVKIETQKDNLLRKVYGFIMFGWSNCLSQEESSKLSAFYQRRNELTVEMGVLMWRCRVVVSEVLQTLILNELHATHLSMAKMKSVACSYVHWPCIDSEFERLSNSCSSCLLDQTSPAKAELHKWHYLNKPWEQLHFDYLGPFGGKMNLIIVDAHSKCLKS